MQGLVEQLRATEKDLADVAAEKDGSFAAYEKLVAENEQLLRQVDGLQDTNISEENEVSELKLRMAQMEADYLADRKLKVRSSSSHSVYHSLLYL